MEETNRRIHELPVLKVTAPSAIPDAGVTLVADVLVIGSGAAGAVTAYELARGGTKVVVSEAGPLHPVERIRGARAEARSKPCTRITGTR